MDLQITTFGALLGLGVSIFLIIKKIHPAYSLILGALIGGIVGGAGLTETVNIMINGSKEMMPSIIRIITSGVLAGVLIQTGSAAKIADQIVKLLGEKHALFALALATMILTASGVFVDISVITVAPIALALGKKLNYSKIAVLLAMIGGGKCGNVVSPNPNTIAASENFGVELSSLMGANVVGALVGLVVTVFLVKLLVNKGEKVKEVVEQHKQEDLPSFFAAILGPLVAIILLALRPLAGITVDPLIALPVGGLIGVIACGKVKQINEYMTFGLAKMMPVAVLLVGASTVQVDTIAILSSLSIPEFLLAPIAGILMGAATASTTAGTTIASATFGPAIMAAGVSALGGAAMVHAGATVLDHLPHGSFFHSTAGATNVSINERLKLIPYESLIGLAITITTTILWGIIL